MQKRKRKVLPPLVAAPAPPGRLSPEEWAVRRAKSVLSAQSPYLAEEQAAAAALEAIPIPAPGRDRTQRRK